jgi:hypothetical protein
VTLLGATANAAEHDFPLPPRAEDAAERVSFSLSYRAGLVEAPFVTSALPEVSGFASVLDITTALRLPPAGWLHARLPFSIVRLDFPAGAQVAETAFGNLQLGLEHGVALGAPTWLGLGAALVVPTAEHGSEASLLDNRALALASALDGGKDALLLTPGVTGLRLGAAIEHVFPPFRVRASLDLPLLARLSDASLTEETDTHAVGMLPALEVRAAAWLSSWFGVLLGSALVTEPLRIQEPARQRDRDRRLQPVFEPGLRFCVGRSVTLGLDGSVAVGGSLGGDAFGMGLGARLGL